MGKSLELKKLKRLKPAFPVLFSASFRSCHFEGADSKSSTKSPG
jgi:hypothetical protein